MFDRLFLAALTFCTLTGGTLAIATAMFQNPAPARQVVQLPTVEITVSRATGAKWAQAEQAAPAASTWMQ